MSHFPLKSISIWKISCMVIITLGNIWNYFVVVLGVPKTTPRVDDSLEQLPGIRKTVILTITIYYNEVIQIKINKGKRYMRWSPGETRHKAPGVLTQWSHIRMHLIFQQSCVTTCEKCCQKGGLLEPGVQSFYLGSVT